MSGLLGQILQAGGGEAVQMLGGRFGLTPSQTRAALEALTPMVAGGFKQQAQAQGGLEQVLGSVVKPGHAAYADAAETVAKPGTTAAGNEILGAIFGSRDVSRAVAGQAAQQSGLSPDLLRQMLPVIATMAAGALASNANAGGLGGLIGAAMGGGAAAPAGKPAAPAAPTAAAPAGAPAGALGGLASMLDLDRDGNPLNDILRMVQR